VLHARLDHMPGAATLAPHNIKHHGDACSFAGVHEFVQSVGSTKVRFNIKLPPCPIPVIAAVSVVDNRANPNGIEPHAGDVRQLLGDSLKRATAVVAVRACGGRGVSMGGVCFRCVCVNVREGSSVGRGAGRVPAVLSSMLASTLKSPL
jgi:hypothetical protein